MIDFSSHAEVIAAIGNSRLAEACGISAKRVEGWRRRNSIPGRWFVAVANAANDMGHLGVSAAGLAEMASVSVGGADRDLRTA